MNKITSITGGITFIAEDGHKIQQSFSFPSSACPDLKALLEMIAFSVNEETGEHFVIKRDTKKINKELGYE